MRPTINHLHKFYHSPLGKRVAKSLQNQVNDWWPDNHALSLVGLGFPLPVLPSLQTNTEKTVALMPARQGASVWQRADSDVLEDRRGNLTAMVESSYLPLPDVSVDRFVMLHLVEHTVDLHTSLREAWRVLKPEGRLLVIAPNRASIWARVENNPFAFGRPFSRSQLNSILEDSQFETVHSRHGLFFPPSQRPTVLKFSSAIDRIGGKIMPLAGGVIFTESIKRMVIQPPKGGMKARVLKRARIT
jgi:SAM-dependent methyltransferase